MAMTQPRDLDCAVVYLAAAEYFVYDLTPDPESEEEISDEVAGSEVRTPETAQTNEAENANPHSFSPCQKMTWMMLELVDSRD